MLEKAQSHAGAWELSWKRWSKLPKLTQDSISRLWSGVQPTCLQVERDPRLVDVRRVALRADPPDRSAVHIFLRGRRHVLPAGQRSLGERRDCERLSAAAAETCTRPGWRRRRCGRGAGWSDGGGREKWETVGVLENLFPVNSGAPWPLTSHVIRYSAQMTDSKFENN